jgi:hypothetical protein
MPWLPFKRLGSPYAVYIPPMYSKSFPWTKKLANAQLKNWKILTKLRCCPTAQATSPRRSIPYRTARSVHDGKGSVHGTSEVIEDVDELERLGVPLQTLWIDNPWELENAPPAQASVGTSCEGHR